MMIYLCTVAERVILVYPCPVVDPASLPPDEAVPPECTYHEL